MKTDYNIERRLATIDSDLHNRYKGCMSISQDMLSRYESTFPDFTDHTVLHSLDILDTCNVLIGDQLDQLSADDLYVLLMGILYHDVGMGISISDYEQFLPLLPNHYVPSPGEERRDVIRKNHQGFSVLFLNKYGEILDFPNDRYLAAVIQVCRGHRKTDLMDEKGYPEHFSINDGRYVTLPYLSALLCLADELDVSVERNLSFTHREISEMPRKKDREEFGKHEAVRSVEILKDKVVLHAKTEDPFIRKGVAELTAKIQNKLDYCGSVIRNRTDFTLTQTKVVLDLAPQDENR